eukprot:TRINITY_DN10714_c0_g1_i3.p1 TRINITY_DN10714_c0_g1~~TRINITY_DN10714_c0_g1_i3.p1  ORF type:complete len:196 (+),score=1.35 TRINITY_DN10714_c0_g1_i3:104-691(+)
MIRRPPRSTQGVSSAASDVYKRQGRICPRQLLVSYQQCNFIDAHWIHHLLNVFSTWAKILGTNLSLESAIKAITTAKFVILSLFCNTSKIFSIFIVKAIINPEIAPTEIRHNNSIMTIFLPVFRNNQHSQSASILKKHQMAMKKYKALIHLWHRYIARFFLHLKIFGLNFHNLSTLYSVASRQQLSVALPPCTLR